MTTQSTREERIQTAYNHTKEYFQRTDLPWAAYNKKPTAYDATYYLGMLYPYVISSEELFYTVEKLLDDDIITA